MAIDVFLKIDGVDGESRDKKHQGEIDVLSWDWGATNSGDMHAGSGGGAGKVDVQDIVIEKWLEKSSAVLMQSCCSGKAFPGATLTVRKSGGDSPVEYLIIKLTDVLVTSIQTGGQQSDDRITEKLYLSFAKFNMVYTPQKQDGTPEASLEAGWDIVENVAYA